MAVDFERLLDMGGTLVLAVLLIWRLDMRLGRLEETANRLLTLVERSLSASKE